MHPDPTSPIRLEDVFSPDVTYPKIRRAIASWIGCWQPESNSGDLRGLETWIHQLPAPLIAWHRLLRQLGKSQFNWSLNDGVNRVYYWDFIHGPAAILVTQTLTVRRERRLAISVIPAKWEQMPWIACSAHVFGKITTARYLLLFAAGRKTPSLQETTRRFLACYEEGQHS